MSQVDLLITSVIRALTLLSGPRKKRTSTTSGGVFMQPG